MVVKPGVFSLSPFLINNKMALVTGAAGLLGRQHVLGLLEAGGTVIASDVSVDLLENTFGDCLFNFYREKLIYERLDVLDEKSIKEISEKYFIHILVNNAAVNPQVVPNSQIGNSSRLEFFPLHEWERQIGIGLTGSFLCSKHIGSRMAQEGSY